MICESEIDYAVLTKKSQSKCFFLASEILPKIRLFFRKIVTNKKLFLETF